MIPFKPVWIFIREILPIEGFKNNQWYVGWLVSLGPGVYRMNFALHSDGLRVPYPSVYAFDMSVRSPDPMVDIAPPVAGTSRTINEAAAAGF